MPSLKAGLIGLALLAAPGLAGAQIVPQADLPGAAGNVEVTQRLATQQTRINRGVVNGTLTAPQAQRLQARDNHIARQESRMKARDPGGTLTRPQTVQLNRELNHTSHAIARDKRQTVAVHANTH
jgi:hypothetical protein